MADLLCTHGLTEYCECLGPPRKTGYLVQRVALKGTGEREPEWTCACRRPDGRPLLKGHRHTRPAECLPQAAIDVWARKVGCGPRVARELFWLELEFSPMRGMNA
jgi:hypothetical protein